MLAKNLLVSTCVFALLSIPQIAASKANSSQKKITIKEVATDELRPLGVRPDTQASILTSAIVNIEQLPQAKISKSRVSLGIGLELNRADFAIDRKNTIDSLYALKIAYLKNLDSPIARNYFYGVSLNISGNNSGLAFVNSSNKLDASGKMINLISELSGTTGYESGKLSTSLSMGLYQHLSSLSSQLDGNDNTSANSGLSANINLSYNLYSDSEYGLALVFGLGYRNPLSKNLLVNYSGLYQSLNITGVYF